MKEKDYLGEFWNYLENKDTNIAKRILNWLNKDNLYSIIAYGGTWWLKMTNSNNEIPNYVFDYIKKYMEKQGYKYLYEKY
jgi:hypothetical protein